MPKHLFKTGHIVSVETRAKISAKQKGVKEKPEISVMLSQRTTEWLKTHAHPKGFLGHKHSEITRKRMSNSQYAREPYTLSTEAKKRMSELKKIYYHTHPNELEKLFINLSKSGFKPSNPERYLDAILQLNFPHEWRYTGDGKILIEGKNPDFVNINGRKILIEYNGFYTHTPEKDKQKTEHYAKYGWTTINLYPIDLKEEIIIKKVGEIYER